jgi:hypothetical protein
MKEPYILDFNKIGSHELGYISVAESLKNVPFEIKRVYWVYDTPSDVQRGNHAHKNGEVVLIALKGSSDIQLINPSGKEYSFHLHDKSKGLYIPSMHWRRLNFEPDSLLLSIASTLYSEDDYIYNYEEFSSPNKK